MKLVSASKSFLLILPMVSLNATNVAAQRQGKRIVIPLHLNLQSEQQVYNLISFGDDANHLTGPIALPGASRVGKARGDVLIKVEGLRQPEHAYKVIVDTNGDGEFMGEEVHTLLPNSSTEIKVIRDWGNRRVNLPYIIRYARLPNYKGEMEETMDWRPHYRAEGELAIGSCRTLIVVFDLNGDGQFNDRDFKKGTSIGLDRNHDGRIWGKDEWLRGEQIIEYCGRYFLVDLLKVDGSSITLVETLLRPVKLGDPVPRFRLISTDGAVIDSRELKDNVFVLDFWASWCAPCLENFGRLKGIASYFGEQIKIISVNVDESSSTHEARNAVIRHKLPWPTVISGLGEADPVWKIFGSTGDNRLPIPLYVVIDRNGIVRYAGHGGEDLGELKKQLEELTRTK